MFRLVSLLSFVVVAVAVCSAFGENERLPAPQVEEPNERLPPLTPRLRPALARGYHAPFSLN